MPGQTKIVPTSLDGSSRTTAMTGKKCFPWPSPVVPLVRNSAFVSCPGKVRISDRLNAICGTAGILFQESIRSAACQEIRNTSRRPDFRFAGN